MSLINNLQQEYDSIFVQEWSPFLAAVVFPLVSTWLLVNGYFWGVFGGIRNWGDWMNAQIGLAAPLGINVERLQSPWMHNISLMDMCLIIGAWSAAMMARKFQLVMPNRQDLITAAVGGSLMGIGASLAMGCNIGGFFNPVNASSPSGWMMALGLVLGAYIGSKIIVWMMEHVQWGLENGGPLSITQPLKSNRFLAPIIGFMVLIVMIGWSIHWFESGDEKLARRGILILSGFVLGYVLQRSRFCFSRAFREPFITGDSTMTRAVILALGIGAFTFSTVFNAGIADPYQGIPPTFWNGALIGGLVFGVGMVLAGGCASGSLWRVGEGHIKLMVALLFFAWTGSTFTALIADPWLVREMTVDLVEVTSVGTQAYLPDIVSGWTMTHLITAGGLLFWYLVVKYNEVSGRFTVI